MKPVIKWACGKTQLLEYIKPLMPKHYNNYFEPFIGGGALIFDLKPHNALINDINTELINMYKQIKYQPNLVIYWLSSLDNNHEQVLDHKEYYYQVRELFNQNLNTDTPEQASRFIYLNKHCFNGLYRVNSKGLFNVPFNNKITGNSVDKDNVIEMSRYLNNVTILSGDFESALGNANKNDFVFFDSPYDLLNPTSFTDYTKEGFKYEDHIRLANLYKSLTDKGVYCMLTNHNTKLINELYSDFNIKVVNVHRNINSDGANRKGEEVIITNY